MKGFKFLIVGGIIAAGVVAYEIYKHFHISDDNNGVNEKSEKDDSFAVKDDNIIPEPYASSGEKVYEEREAVVSSVKERHYEAAKAMEDSLNTIFRETGNEDIVTENSDALNKTGGDLEDLLK